MHRYLFLFLLGVVIGLCDGFRRLQLNQTHTITPANFKGISIYGLETNLKNTVCSWKHPAEYYLGECKRLGMNTFRVPISIQYLVEENYQILDNIVRYCDEEELQVIIDFHRVSNDYQQPNPDQGIKEFNGVATRDEMVNQMIKILQRYVNNASVVCINSWNEYTGLDANYKRDWDRFVYDRVEASFPGRFIYASTGLNWAGVLTGLSEEDFPYADRIIYGVHKYHFSGSGHEDDWEASFGNAFPPEKINIGEWGFRDPEDMEFGREFAAYLLKKGIKNQEFWTIAHSGDTGGLWYDDCENINYRKYEIIKPLLN